MYDVSTEEIAVELCSICKKNGYVMSEETQAEVEQSSQPSELSTRGP